VTSEAACAQVVKGVDKATGNETTLVVILDAPVNNATAETLMFNITAEVAGSKPKVASGAAAGALAGAGTPGLRAPSTGLLLTVRRAADL
jgi:hypothetical protein